MRQIVEGPSGAKIKELNLTNCVRVSDVTLLRIAQRLVQRPNILQEKLSRTNARDRVLFLHARIFPSYYHPVLLVAKEYYWDLPLRYFSGVITSSTLVSVTVNTLPTLVWSFLVPSHPWCPLICQGVIFRIREWRLWVTTQSSVILRLLNVQTSLTLDCR